MTDPLHNQAKEVLDGYVRRIQNLNAEIAASQEDRKSVYAEAKANGYDPKILKKVIADLERDKKDVADEQAIYHLYLRTLGWDLLA
ncbi:DUF2312 domain-containing protein [Pannonibacter tanglangensis]|uniref:DUF2312 domain-containing protein n=1 Tax=Pannonibacter tanglangensis TaxID=2750084 RepID=A0ABW9ZGD8_9HYPH|nr:DUF2312 domain-containing protein [Pannonibacter sp. XCT-34]NBN62087.1 DUF2312 domain-containing protein [Pannonibacter sp. XCT-34]